MYIKYKTLIPYSPNKNEFLFGNKLTANTYFFGGRKQPALQNKENPIHKPPTEFPFFGTTPYKMRITKINALAQTQ